MASQVQSSEYVPAAEAESEDAPLLDSSDTYEEPTPAPRPKLTKPIRISTWLSLALPVVIWPFIIALNILWSNQPNDYSYNWSLANDVNILLGGSIAAFIFSLANLIRLRYWKLPVPLFINLIANWVMAFYVLIASVDGAVAAVTRSSCHHWQPYPRPGYPEPEPTPIDPRCAPFARKVMIFAECAMGLGVVLGITSFVLAVLNTILAYRTKFWRNAMRIPTGTFSIELTFRILRQEDQGASRPTTQPTP